MLKTSLIPSLLSSANAQLSVEKYHMLIQKHPFFLKTSSAVDGLAKVLLVSFNPTILCVYKHEEHRGRVCDG